MPMGAAAPHVHLFNPMAVLRFNPSHRILHLSFGDPDHRGRRRQSPRDRKGDFPAVVDAVS